MQRSLGDNKKIKGIKGKKREKNEQEEYKELVVCQIASVLLQWWLLSLHISLNPQHIRHWE